MAKRKGKPLQVYLDEDVQAALEKLAEENGRAIAVEVRRAIARYLLNPERITASEPEPTPKKKKGGA